MNQPPAAPQTSRADAAPERGPADPRAPSFGAVLAARGPKAAPNAAPTVVDSRGESPVEEPTADIAAAPDAAPAPVAPRTPVVARFNIVDVAPPAPVEESTMPSADAWGEFLGRMNDELGVSSEDVLHAFESLSDEDLARTPEETTDQMVAALGLTGTPAALAKTYFRELIVRTNVDADGNASTAPAPAPISERSIDKSADRALERMDQHLMMNSPTVRPPSVPGARTASLKTASSEAEAPAPEPASLKDFDQLVDQMTPVAAGDQRAEPKVDRLVREMIEGRPAASPVPQMNFKMDEPAPVSPRDVSAVAPEAKLAESIFAAARPSGDDAADSDEDSDDLGEDLSSSIETGPAPVVTAGVNSDFASELAPKVNDVGGPAPSLSPDIVDNARVMVRNGGGEMRVTLNAEGLGEVAMKVHVRDGKVSVEMLTESQEAKRLLEHQLGDLKAQLISNHLQVDRLHVDTSSNLARHDQSNPDQRGQSGREQAFAQFNQQTGEQAQHRHDRRQMLEATRSRAYGGPAAALGRAGFAPPPPTADRAANSRRLNLVA